MGIYIYTYEQNTHTPNIYIYIYMYIYIYITTTRTTKNIKIYIVDAGSLLHLQTLQEQSIGICISICIQYMKQCVVVSLQF